MTHNITHEELLEVLVNLLSAASDNADNFDRASARNNALRLMERLEVTREEVEQAGLINSF